MEDINKTLDVLDELAATEGEAVNKETIQYVTGDDAIRTVDTAAAMLNDRPYGESGPVPGESIGSYMDEQKEVTKKDAINKLIQQSAIYKAEQERLAAENQTRKLTKEEREKKKKQICDYILYEQERMYFNQNGYIMDGRTKRRMKAIISKNYDKGKYTQKEGKAVDLNG